MLLSYCIGQKKAPIPYDLRSIGVYTALTIGLLAVYYFCRYYLKEYQLSTVNYQLTLMAVGTALIGIYLFILTRKDFPIANVLRNRRNNGSSRQN